MYIHCSSKYLGKEVVFNPRIPKDRMSYENDNVPRICMSTSIDGCLTAIDTMYTWFEGDRLVYVYVCIVDEKYVIHPTVEDVPDVLFSGEVWSTVPTTLKHILTIQLVDYLDYDIRFHGSTMLHVQCKYRIHEDLKYCTGAEV